MSAERETSWLTHLKPGRKTLAAAGAISLLALWWQRRQSEPTEAEHERNKEGATFISYEPATRGADRESAPDDMPSTLPECCIHVLGRPDWYSRELLRSVQVKPANAFVRLISSPRVAGTEITATTIGDTIYFRKPEGFDPHSASGLALLAHEIRHVEQYREHGGVVSFGLHYIREYLRGGYGTDISFEAEAYEIGDVVYAHLVQEFDHNDGVSHCIMTPAGEHSANLAYAYLEPYPELSHQA